MSEVLVVHEHGEVVIITAAEQGPAGAGIPGGGLPSQVLSVSPDTGLVSWLDAAAIDLLSGEDGAAIYLNIDALRTDMQDLIALKIDELRDELMLEIDGLRLRVLALEGA